MAKKSIIIREKKRKFLINKFFKKRVYLKKIISNLNTSNLDRWKSIVKLQSLPRDSSYVRSRNRCNITGRSYSYMRKFGLSRIKFREFACKGYIPGLKKSSW